jgi:hypothetical protein
MSITPTTSRQEGTAKMSTSSPSAENGSMRRSEAGQRAGRISISLAGMTAVLAAGIAAAAGMASRPRGRRSLLALALIMVSTLTGCAAGTGSAVQATRLLSQQPAPPSADLMVAGRIAAASGLLKQMKSTASQAQRMNELPRLTAKQFGVRQTTTQIDSQLGQLPRNPTTEMARVADQLRQAQRRLNEIHSIQRAADSAVSKLPTGAQQVAGNATRTAGLYLTPNEVARLRQALADKVYEQALELGCDALWNGLSQRDKTTASDAYNNGHVVSTYTDRLKAATVQAVVDDAYRRALDTLGPQAGPRVRQAVAWGTYAQGVFGKALALQENDWQALRQITASGHTTALIHYARVCLRPPR